MLTLATLGMFIYGGYSFAGRPSTWCEAPGSSSGPRAGLMIFGLLLALSAAFVRVRLPGGLAVAIGAMLGLQALAVHNAVHLAGGLASQIVGG